MGETDSDISSSTMDNPTSHLGLSGDDAILNEHVYEYFNFDIGNTATTNEPIEFSDLNISSVDFLENFDDLSQWSINEVTF